MIKIIRYCVLISFVIPSAQLLARDVRTPLVLYRDYLHYPLDRYDEVDNCTGIAWNFWGAGYSRTAFDAFGHQTACSAPSDPALNCGSPNRIDLTALFFGASNFKLGQAFADSNPIGGTNPFVIVSTLSPRYDYHEQGAFFGMHAGGRFGCNKRWRSGLRVRLPYRDIDLEEGCGASSSEADTIGETLNDLYRQRQETNTFSPGGPVTNTVWTARLDFLSALKRIAFTSTGTTENLVKYADPNKGNEITIGNQRLSDNLSSAQPPTPISPFVEAIASSDGSIPGTVRWGNRPESGATVIAADGSGLGNLVRGRFVNNVSYVPLGGDSAAQSRLWIVPDVSGATGLVLDGANTVNTEISQSIANLQSNSIADFLKAQQLSFCAGGRQRGLGDLDLEWYIGYQHECDDWWGDFWGEFLLGLRLPTGKKVTNPLLLAAMPTGNNGHVEIRPGLFLGFDRWENVKIHSRLTYSWVLSHIEHLPAAFKGATIMNIGPDVPGRVSWRYFWGNVVATIVHPCNRDIGMTIGYEAYVKSCDHISFCNTEAVDFNGQTKPLDASVLARNSHRVAQNISAELFCRAQCCQLFLGFSQVIAGKNVTRDTDMYIGLEVSF